MADAPVRVRIGPSPTGEPHVGTAYMALYNRAFALQQGGKFILRIEDTDRNRYVDGSEEKILSSLKWLGLDWDEGPDKGGPFGPYRQSERLPLYQKYARQLLEMGHAYECWCSPERLEEMRADQKRRGLDPKYDRYCLGKTREQRASEPGFSETPVIRMLVPDNPPLTFHDVIRGDISAPFPEDQVILKSDGFPTYHLAVVVDDHHMQISHTTRGEEWISSTPKHLLLYDWLGWEPPKFAHFPLLRNTDRSKIGKRKNPAARLTWFRDEGFLPEALLNFLATVGWSMPDGREVFSFSDLVENFAWDRFNPVGPVVDMAKMDWLNGQYIQHLTDDEFVSGVMPFLPLDVDREAIRVLATSLKMRLTRLSGIREQVSFLYEDVVVDKELLVKQGLDAGAARNALSLAAEMAQSTEPFSVDALEIAFDSELKRQGWKKRSFFMTVRAAVTGKTVTPPLFDVLVALGRDRTVRRLKVAADELAST